MDKISKDGEYEIIHQKYNPVYPDWVKSIETVKKFIIDNGLIVYGGTAIDFAMRLKGSRLYNDDSLLVADLDFYSPTHAEHAYTLADILYAEGHEDVRVINAIHYSTMKVDIRNNTFVADISYCPQAILDKIPTLVFQGMRFVAPQYQYIDMHRLLSNPFEDAPRENIFNRAKKDSERFNLLYAMYPVVSSFGSKDETTAEQKKEKNVSHQVKINNKFVIHGFAAYAIIYEIFASLIEKIPPEVIKLGIKANKGTLEATLPDKLTIIHLNSEKLALKDAKRYRPLAHLIPAKIETLEMRVILTDNELISINEVALFGVNVRICNIQYVMRWMLTMEYDDTFDVSTRQYYLSMIKMINTIENAWDGLDEGAKKKAAIFFPSIEVYGVRNKTPSQQIFEGKINAELYGEKIKYVSPINYYPENKRAHPVFDYDNSPFFRVDGSEIE